MVGEHKNCTFVDSSKWAVIISECRFPMTEKEMIFDIIDKPNPNNWDSVQTLPFISLPHWTNVDLNTIVLFVGLY